MFGVARFIFRNKIVVVAVAAVGVFLASGDKQPNKPSSPWGVGATAPVVTSEGSKASLTDKALKVVDGAAKMAGVEEFSPSALKEQAVGNLSKTDNALKNAGSN